MNVTIFESSIEIDHSRISESPATIRTQVGEYVRGRRRTFDVEVTPVEGIPGEVMIAMADIPYGETRTYGEIADRLDTAAVTVGRACADNPVPLIVPCHRVIGSDGDLKGYSAADGVATKRRLLDLEAEVTGSPIQTHLPTRD